MTLDGVTVTVQLGGLIEIGTDGKLVLIDAAEIDGGDLVFDNATGTLTVDSGSDGTGAVLDGVDVIGQSGDIIQVIDHVDLTLGDNTFIGDVELSIDSTSTVEISSTTGALFDDVNVVDDDTLQIDTGSALVLGGGTDISGSGQIVNFATVYIDNSVTISDSISLSGGTVALTSGADLTLDDVNASNTAITAGTFVALTDPDVATTIYYDMQAVAVDSAGAVVGTYVDTNFADRSFIYSNGGYTAIDDPDAPLPSNSESTIGTVATSINDESQIAGYYYGSDGGAHGFIATDPVEGYTYVTVDDPNAVNNQGNDLAAGTFVTSINTAGDAVGYYQTTMGGLYTGFIYDSATSTFTDLTGPVGAIGIDAGSAGGTGDAGGPILINDEGQVAGTYFGDSDGAYGFVYSSETGGYITISDPNVQAADGFGTVIEGLNDSGTVVGYYRSTSSVKLTTALSLRRTGRAVMTTWI